jgi:hypothetical protein
VSTSLIEDVHSYKIDNITTTTDPSSEQVTEINDQLKSQQLDEDILLDTSPSINGNDVHGERHFRRRRRRSSLTKTSTSVDETSTTINLLDKIDINQQQSLEINETLELKPNDDKQDTHVIETNSSGNEESNKTNVDDDKLAPLSRYRGRSMC